MSLMHMLVALYILFKAVTFGYLIHFIYKLKKKKKLNFKGNQNTINIFFSFNLTLSC